MDQADDLKKDKNMILMGKNMVILGRDEPRYIFRNWDGEKWLECFETRPNGEYKQVDPKTINNQENNDNNNI